MGIAGVSIRPKRAPRRERIISHHKSDAHRSSRENNHVKASPVLNLPHFPVDPREHTTCGVDLVYRFRKRSLAIIP